MKTKIITTRVTRTRTIIVGYTSSLNLGLAYV